MPPGDAVQVELARPSALFGGVSGAAAGAGASDGGYNLFSSPGGLFGAFGGGVFGGVVREQPKPQQQQQQQQQQHNRWTSTKCRHRRSGIEGEELLSFFLQNRHCVFYFQDTNLLLLACNSFALCAKRRCSEWGGVRVSSTYEFIRSFGLFDQFSCSLLACFHSSIPHISTNRFDLCVAKKKKKKKTLSTRQQQHLTDSPYTTTICCSMNEVRRPTHHNHSERRRNEAGQNLGGVVHWKSKANVD
jgi:hypothetical protein